ncbi:MULTISPECIES: hypothetical protein [unclassified Streptomyces]|uniref:hypothetical protein n=1 Tax=unclassified Streptomyces TaxID=2593676 RepID=UPI00201ED4E3|nr:hypothetical protein [Streptomyces sp. 35G-GA-8]MCL7377113.1 hypothetical protein [Streptomyces sp. 35G-GA-8]
MAEREAPASATEDYEVVVLIPAGVPWEFAEPTPELVRRVERGLRRLADEAK